MGDTVTWDGLVLEVTALDGRRVDRLHVRETDDDGGTPVSVEHADPGVAGQHP